MCVSVIKSADVDDLAQSCVFLYCHVGLQQSLRGIHSFVDEQKGVEYQFEAVKHFKHSLRSTVVMQRICISYSKELPCIPTAPL